MSSYTVRCGESFSVCISDALLRRDTLTLVTLINETGHFSEDMSRQTYQCFNLLLHTTANHIY